MPTTRRRHAITETDEITQALNAARRAWPHLADKPNELLRQLILTGEHALTDATESRLEAIASTSGVLTGAFPPGYLDNIRQDWPE
ncbi:hypothetical protein HZU40_00225 (plasmid) [Mycolicibacterium fluoranthenivorans]|uniref:Uncharacterized protein n=1 Tax=Mycolicibacterium fluoranthenivorans TaxID=258505 RepID=A0A7G8P6G4_9MYCO|nr:hypothetical protein [Mycolicibacterium fluoranthenivorans]QNJ89930.1 hypothetical protein HZU40_00225 [Mycolicibacterium fluoranthenivorans]